MSIAGDDFSLSSLDENDDDKTSTFGNDGNDNHRNANSPEHHPSTSFADILNDAGYREDLLSDDDTDEDEIDNASPGDDDYDNATGIKRIVQHDTGNSPEHHHQMSYSSDMLNDACYRDDLLSDDDDSDDDANAADTTSPSSAPNASTTTGESVLHSLERDMIAKNEARPVSAICHTTVVGALAVDNNNGNTRVNTTLASPGDNNNRPSSSSDRNSADESNYLEDFDAIMEEDDDDAVDRMDHPRSGESAISQLERDIVTKNQCRPHPINSSTEVGNHPDAPMLQQGPDHELQDCNLAVEHQDSDPVEDRPTPVAAERNHSYTVESTELANVAMSESTIELTELSNGIMNNESTTESTELAEGTLSESTLGLAETHAVGDREWAPSVLTILTAVPQQVIDEKVTRQRTFLWFLIGLVVGFVVCGLVATFAFVAIIRSQDGNAHVPTLAPSLSPTLATIPVLMELFQRLSNVETLQDPNSPQNQALQWIAALDGDFSLPSIVQLYVLVVFYFAMGGEDWHICGRNSPPCNYRARNGTSNWLSSEHVCSWHMVRCNEQQEVYALEAGKSFRVELKGTVPSEIQHLFKLEVLLLINYGLHGPILSYTAQMENLTELELQGNHFSGDMGPTFFAVHPNLRILNLTDNNLTGHIPETIGQSSYLNVLHISQNQFSGEIPPSVFALSILRELVIGDNDFMGTIDTAIGSMTSLSILSLEKSMMSGKLPTEMFSLSLLEILRINDSNFHGPLHDENFQKLTKLRILNLHNNDFTGSLPITTLEQSTSLKEFRLDGNTQMTGEVTEAVCAKRDKPRGLFSILRVGCNIQCRDGCCDQYQFCG